MELENLLAAYREKHNTLGVIGFGKYGKQVRDTARSLGMNVLVCDPPQAEAQLDDEYNDLMIQWGNGMGGCGTVREDPAALLPQDYLLKHTDLLVLAVPLTENVTQPTKGMINGAFLRKFSPEGILLNLSDPATVADGITDPRVRFPQVTEQ